MLRLKRSARRALRLLLEPGDELLLRHVRAALDAGPLRVLVQLRLRLVGVDATVSAPPAPGGRSSLRGLGVRRPLASLRLPMVALLLGDVLDRGPRGAVRP